jgi:DtxR family Mn-dependent transcriptional regulator
MSQPLTHLRVGQRGQITAIQSQRESRLANLSTLGIVPGSMLTLRQRHFAYVVMVGETEVALDADVAGEIMVQVQ